MVTSSTFPLSQLKFWERDDSGYALNWNRHSSGINRPKQAHSSIAATSTNQVGERQSIQYLLNANSPAYRLPFPLRRRPCPPSRWTPLPTSPFPLNQSLRPNPPQQTSRLNIFSVLVRFRPRPIFLDHRRSGSTKHLSSRLPKSDSIWNSQIFALSVLVRFHPRPIFPRPIYRLAHL